MTSTTPSVKLSQEQRAAVAHLMSFPKQAQTLGGYAGTGKSTVISLRRSEMVFHSAGEDYKVVCLLRQFNQEKKADWQQGCLPFDYCYAVTCHKAQGDEWDRVVVIEQRCDRWDHARWAYTAASRARKSLIWIPA